MTMTSWKALMMEEIRLAMTEGRDGGASGEKKEDVQKKDVTDSMRLEIIPPPLRDLYSRRKKREMVILSLPSLEEAGT